MLTLRPEQMQVFSEAAVKRFENDMVEHLKKFFRAKCEAMGESHVRELVRYGIERAAIYEIRAERDVCVFVDVMLVIGQDFDLRIENGWAVRILNDRERNTPSERVMRLGDETLQRLSSEEEGNVGR